MSKSLRTLFVSVEDENDINETTLEVSSDNTMEEEVAEVTEAGIEVIEAEDDVEELHEIAEGLESIVASLEAAVEDGGLDAQAAIFMQHAVNGYTRRVGLEAETIVPSLESFGGASGKAAATTISVEGVKETIQRVWQAIKNAVAKAITAAKNFFAKIFGGVKKLRERHGALSKTVNDLSGKKAEGKIKVAAANTLRYNGKVDASSVATGLKNTAEVGDKVFNKLTAGAASFYSNAAQKIANKDALEKSDQNALEALLTEANAKFVVASKEITSYTKAMAGDASFKSEGKESSSMIPTLKKGVIGSNVNEGIEIDVPSQSDLKSMLDSLDTIIKLMENKKSTVESLSTAREETVKKTETFVKMVSTGKFDEKLTNAKVSWALRSVNSDLTRPINSFVSYAFTVVRAGLAYVDRAAKSYE